MRSRDLVQLGLLLLVSAIGVDAMASPPGWVTIAGEGEAFTVAGTRTVRYGADERWVVKTVTGSGECSNAFFGGDPAYMTVKQCQVEGATPGPALSSVPEAASASPATAPTLVGTDFALASPVGGTRLPFTLGFAVRQGDVPRGRVLAATTGVELQCVVKNRWPDGSAKFVVLSGHADLQAGAPRRIELQARPPAGGETPLTPAVLRSAGLSAAIRFSPFGTASWAPGDWERPTQVGVGGPQMASFIYRKALGNDPHLVAWLEVRAYKGGRVEVLPWIENGFLNVRGPAAKAGLASFVLGGSERFAQPLELLNHQRAVLASGTTLTHWWGGDPQVTPRHGVAYLMATRLVPHYAGITVAGSRLYARLPQSYTPLAQASFSPDMPKPGYEPGIGLLPEWDAAYLTTGGDPRAWRAVVINGYAAGRYGIHYRDETTHRVLLFSHHPDLVMARAGSGVNHVGSSDTGRTTPPNTGAPPPLYDSPHHPSMGYMAYLLTGWHYFAEQTQFLATANYLKNGTASRQRAKGIMETSAGSNTVRGAAWAIRTLAQAATITPDDDAALRAQLVASLDENIAYYHGRYVARPHNPFGLVQPYSNYNDGDPWTYAVWMDDFFTASFGYLADLQAHSPALQARLEAFLAWKYRAVVGRLGSGQPGTYNYRHAAVYTMNYAPRANADFAQGNGPWYADWGELAASMGVPPADGDTRLEGSSGSDPANMAQGFWGNLLPALAYAVDDGAEGAAAAYERLTGASNYTVNAATFNDTPVWGITPRAR